MNSTAVGYRLKASVMSFVSPYFISYSSVRQSDEPKWVFILRKVKVRVLNPSFWSKQAKSNTFELSLPQSQLSPTHSKTMYPVCAWSRRPAIRAYAHQLLGRNDPAPDARLSSYLQLTNPLVKKCICRQKILIARQPQNYSLLSCWTDAWDVMSEYSEGAGDWLWWPISVVWIYIFIMLILSIINICRSFLSLAADDAYPIGDPMNAKIYFYVLSTVVQPQMLFQG